VIPDKVWDILEMQGVVPAPKLPDVGKVATKAREKQCSVQVNYPADEDEFVFAVVSRQGQSFTGEAAKDVEAVAIALADCLEQTEPRQLELVAANEPEAEPDFGPPPDFMPGEEPKPKTRKKSGKKSDIFDDVAAHLEAVGEPIEGGEEGQYSEAVETGENDGIDVFDDVEPTNTDDVDGPLEMA
jgi:hypothetical protein